MLLVGSYVTESHNLHFTAGTSNYTNCHNNWKIFIALPQWTSMKKNISEVLLQVSIDLRIVAFESNWFFISLLLSIFYCTKSIKVIFFMCLHVVYHIYTYIFNLLKLSNILKIAFFEYYVSSSVTTHSIN